MLSIKNKKSVELIEVKKRQHTSYNCPECNSTFDSKDKMGKHLKEQHQGKILSPERKIAKMNHEKIENKDSEIGEVDSINMEEKKKELENLQDLLLQTGKEKEELNIRLSNCNIKCLSLEKENATIAQERNYLKVENEKAIRNMNDLDKEYITQIQGLKRNEAQKEHEIIF